jgi:ATP-binding cassette subfamily F protein uup
MTALISLRHACLDLGTGPLLDHAAFTVEEGERVALVGRNGAGKSTLLRVLTGVRGLDDGSRDARPGLRVGELVQEVPREETGSLFEVVAAGAGPVGRALASLRARPDHPDAPAWQDALDAAGAWDLEARVERTLERLGLDAEARFETQSGGLRRRALLGQALMGDPDLLLLDEPTNHLDVASIEALEDTLIEGGVSVLFVSHDRSFVDRVATRIVELDRGHLHSYGAGWDAWVEAREERLEVEAKQNALFDRNLAKEEAWIRQGVKARRTRDMGRVGRLMEMRKERARRRNLTGSARMEIVEAERSGRLVAELEGVTLAWGDRVLCRDLDLLVMRGDRLALMGPNGAGKTTLLQVLTGERGVEAGRVRRGTQLQVARLTQLRETLNLDATLMDAVADGNDRIQVGERTRHVAGYLQDFLFDPQRLRQPVRVLSGGERNRLLLARVFARPSNLLVLDEPTNDLDLETLELLEELLMEYTGTVLLVSHDRTFVDRVATSVIFFEGEGRVQEYAGGYSDARAQQRASRAQRVAAAPQAPPAQASAEPSKATPAARAQRLAPWEAKELDALPARIEALEAEVASLQTRLSDPALWSAGGDAGGVQKALQAKEGELAAAYARWELLEARRAP